MNASSYQLVSESERLCREFASPGFEAWLERLSTAGYCQIVIALLLKLERLVQAPLDATRRVEILHALMGMVGDVADDLPRTPPPGPGRGGPAATLSLAERLGDVTFRNLKRALEDLDRGGGRVLGEHDAGRVWVVAAMFACLGRRIERIAQWGHAWPVRTWQELHDLFSYCANRLVSGPADSEWIGADGAAHRGPAAPGAGGATAFDPESAYKRLLMVGLCAEQGAGALLSPPAAEHFPAWVEAAELHDPGAYFGVLGTYLVEASGDAPARLVPGTLGPVTRAWVLHLSPEFLAALHGVKAGRHPFGTE